MKIFILTALLLVSQNIYSAKIPHSWNSCHNSSINTEAMDKSGSNFGQSLEVMFTDMSEFGEDIKDVTDKAQAHRKFKLTEITTMLGVSAEGSIGVLGIGGAAVAEIHWGRIEGNDKTSRSNKRKKRRKTDLKMNGSLSLPKLEKKIETLTEYLHKSGKVKNKKQLKKNLLKSALSFKEMASSIDANRHKKWGLAAVQANFGVEASGNVGYVSVGAAVEITFEWTFTQVSPEKVPGTFLFSALEKNEKQKILTKVIKVIQEDLNKTLSKYEVHPHLRTTAFEIGLAVGASGDVGVASVGASVGMTLVFERNEEVLEENAQDKGLTNVKYLPMAQKIKTTNKAKARNRNFKIVKLARRKFRKGLKKALKIGEYLSKKALKVSRRNTKNRKWGFSGLTAVFELGLEGGIGVATLSGGSAVEIEFENPNF